MKASKKIDGVADAVHYDSHGLLAFLRVYPRRGATYSDHVLLNRPELIALLKSGKRLCYGQRKASMGFTFEPGPAIRLVSRDGQEYVQAEGAGQAGDDLAGVPRI